MGNEKTLSDLLLNILSILKYVELEPQKKMRKILDREKYLKE